MSKPQDPTTQVLIQYANENLQLRLENARLQAELTTATQDTAEPGDD